MKVKVEIIESTIVSGKAYQAGKVVELPERDALLLIQIGRAKPYIEKDKRQNNKGK